MNKSMHKMQRGFSLAEALITLLIVCLITLASIPILTKKKRDVNNGGHGKWLCTINSAGQYVYWDSETKVGDVNNPDTWSLNADQTKCTFVPKPGKKNYTVTLIGGGSAGGDGSSEREIFLNASRQSFTPTESGDYRLAVIGAGGGGSGSEDCDGSTCATGGQGGGGAAWIGTVYLNAYQTYSSVIASGADGKRDGGNRKTHANGVDEVFSVFKVGTDELIKAGRGKGGRCTFNNGGHSPKGGIGGIGGSIITTDLFSAYSSNAVISVNGREGQGGDTCTGNGCRPWLSHGIENGLKIPENLWGDTSSSQYGRGGNGKTAWRQGDVQGDRGSDGIVLLWRVKKETGAGGEASPLQIYTFPEIQSKIDFVVGRGGGRVCYSVGGSERVICNNNGEPTRGQLYNSGNHIYRTLQSSFGKYPESNVTSYSGSGNASGGNGKASLWNGSGGTGGTCYDSSLNITYTTEKQKVPRTDSSGKPICRVKLCKVGIYNNLNGTREGANKANNKCPYKDTDNLPGVCIGVSAPSTSTVAQLNARASQYNNCLSQIELEDDMNNSVTVNNIKQKCSQQLISDSTIIGEVDSNIMAFYYSQQLYKSGINLYQYSLGIPIDNLCECYAYAYDEKTVKVPHWSYDNTPGCNDAGNANFFGAGGGGGGASDYIGVSGKGGKGGNGAAIVEW